MGIEILTDPEWQTAGQITFANGRRRYFKYNSLDINPFGAATIAQDKDYASFFMEQFGYPVVPGSRTFFSTRWSQSLGITGRGLTEAFEYAQQLGFPVIVKPNGGSLGKGVALVRQPDEFKPAMRAVLTRHRVGLVQTVVPGDDFRVVVLDNRVMAAYQRLPLHILGDGEHTVEQLLSQKLAGLAEQHRHVAIPAHDSRLESKLRAQDLTMNTVVEPGRRVVLLDNANLSSGGEAVDVTESMHPEFARQAVQLTKDMGLRLCGVDIMVDGDISQVPDKWWVIEINASPGLDHFAQGGPIQRQRVEWLYQAVLEKMAEEVAIPLPAVNTRLVEPAALSEVGD